MKRMIRTAWATWFAVAGLSATADGALAGEKVTLQGEVLDSTCYMAHGEKGKGHKQCAQQCLRKGIPAALLTDDQKVILLLPSHDAEGVFQEVKKLAAERVEVKGERIEKGGMTAVVVDSIKELKTSTPAKEEHSSDEHQGHMH